MKLKYFNICKREAEKSDHPQHRIGGCIVKKSQVISKGCNKTRTHPKSNFVFKSIHCELDCLLKSNRKDLKNSTIYLYRQTKNGDIAISRPCPWCMKLLKMAQISKVCYSDKDGFKEEVI